MEKKFIITDAQVNKILNALNSVELKGVVELVFLLTQLPQQQIEGDKKQ